MSRTDRPGEVLAAASPMGTLVRAVLVIALALTLVGVLRWAVNITNANARQVASNLVTMQSRFGQETATPPQAGAASGSREKSAAAMLDPIIEPRQ